MKHELNLNYTEAVHFPVNPITLNIYAVFLVFDTFLFFFGLVKTINLPEPSQIRSRFPDLTF